MPVAEPPKSNNKGLKLLKLGRNGRGVGISIPVKDFNDSVQFSNISGAV